MKQKTSGFLTVMFVAALFASMANVVMAQKSGTPTVGRVEIQYDGLQAKTFSISGSALC